MYDVRMRKEMKFDGDTSAGSNHGYGHTLRVVSQDDPEHPLWVATARDFPSNGRSLCVSEVRELRDFCNETLQESVESAPKMSRDEIVARFTNGRLSDGDVARLARRIAREAVSAWSYLSDATRDEIVKHWRLWLEVNLPG